MADETRRLTAAELRAQQELERKQIEQAKLAANRAAVVAAENTVTERIRVAVESIKRGWYEQVTGVAKKHKDVRFVGVRLFPGGAPDNHAAAFIGG